MKPLKLQIMGFVLGACVLGIGIILSKEFSKTFVPKQYPPSTAHYILLSPDLVGKRVGDTVCQFEIGDTTYIVPKFKNLSRIMREMRMVK